MFERGFSEGLFHLKIAIPLALERFGSRRCRGWNDYETVGSPFYIAWMHAAVTGDFPSA